MLKYSSRHKSRDQHLPEFRQKLLDAAVADLTNDPEVLAIYLGGSLAKGNDDLYSDIDLRVVVPNEKKDFLLRKNKIVPVVGATCYFLRIGAPG